jgi:hypothetical protein
MDAYIEAHVPIAAEFEQQWEDLKRVRELWWQYKHHASDEVVTRYEPRGVGGLAKRIAEQNEAYEADFPGAAARAAAKRQEIRRLSIEAEKRVNAMIKAWA